MSIRERAVQLVNSLPRRAKVQFQLCGCMCVSVCVGVGVQEEEKELFKYITAANE